MSKANGEDGNKRKMSNENYGQAKNISGSNQQQHNFNQM